MVQRYDFMFGTLEQCEHSEGDFVEYEDYAELKQTLAAARTYVKDAAKTDAHAFGLLRAIDAVFNNDN